MLNNKFTVSTSIAICFLILKIIENKFILKENKKPMKFLVRDTIIVYISCFIGLFVIEQLTPLTEIAKVPTVFVNEPDF